jgi:hypothetical protein
MFLSVARPVFVTVARLGGLADPEWIGGRDWIRIHSVQVLVSLDKTQQVALVLASLQLMCLSAGTIIRSFLSSQEMSSTHLARDKDGARRDCAIHRCHRRG